MMLPTWWLALPAPVRKAAPWIVLGLAVLLLFTVQGCVADWRQGSQAKQTEASGKAANRAGETAVGTVQERATTEAGIDAAVNDAMQEIDNAPNQQAARAAALRALCGLPEYRKDPACRV